MPKSLPYKRVGCGFVGYAAIRPGAIVAVCRLQSRYALCKGIRTSVSD